MIFRTSLGEFEMRMVRLNDPEPGGKLCPLRDFLGLRRYQTKSNELEKEVIEAVSSDSYRKSHDLLVHTSCLDVTHQTMHNWLLKTSCVMCIIGRRIKKIAYGWKKKGVCKMAKTLLKRFADEAEWKNCRERHVPCDESARCGDIRNHRGDKFIPQFLTLPIIHQLNYSASDIFA